MPETTSSFLDKLQPAPQKKLLALDGGRIRGVLRLEILAAVEEIVRKNWFGRTPRWPTILTRSPGPARGRSSVLVWPLA